MEHGCLWKVSAGVKAGIAESARKGAEEQWMAVESDYQLSIIKIISGLSS